MRRLRTNASATVLVLCFSLFACTSHNTYFWSEGSEQLQLEAFGFEGGSFEWSAERSALSRAQLEALEGIRYIAPAEHCGADGLEVTLTAVDSSGREKRAITNEAFVPCSEEGEALNYETVQPLLSTLNCVATGEAGEDLGKAQTLVVGDGCRHGFFSYAGDPPRWVKLKADATKRAHTFSISRCAGKETGLEVFDESGTELIAETGVQQGGESSCPTLRTELEPGKTYALRVTARALTTGGHILLEARSE